MFLNKPIRGRALKSILLDNNDSDSKQGNKPVYNNNNSSSSSSSTNNNIDKTPKGDIKLLLAEDNSMNVLVIKRLLENLGYSDIDAVGNGKLAVAAQRETPYDIILMDIMVFLLPLLIPI